VNIAWLDLETTGLDPSEQVLEVACIVTNQRFEELGRWSSIIKPIDRMDLLTLDPVVREMHTKNGLIAQLQAGHGLELGMADTYLADWITFVATQAAPDGKLVKPQLGGSTIDFDRMFLRRHMPRTFATLHYRNVDVSTINELAKRWWPDVYKARPASNRSTEGSDKVHRAMHDIEDSLGLARYFVRALGPVVASSVSTPA
jgi:oligoribonuclease